MYSHLHASGCLTSPAVMAPKTVNWPWEKQLLQLGWNISLQSHSSFVIPTNWHGKIWHIFWQYLVDIICSDYIYIYSDILFWEHLFDIYIFWQYIQTYTDSEKSKGYNWTSAIKISRQLKTWTLEERSQYLENQGIVTAKQDLCGMAGAVWQAWFLHQKKTWAIKDISWLIGCELGTLVATII